MTRNTEIRALLLELLGLAGGCEPVSRIEETAYRARIDALVPEEPTGVADDSIPSDQIMDDHPFS